MNDGLELQLTERLLESCRECERFNYFPNKFRQMMLENGSVATMKSLLKGPPQDGFLRLLEENRLDLSGEAIILEPQFQVLFTAGELQIARDRLGR